MSSKSPRNRKDIDINIAKNKASRDLCYHPAPVVVLDASSIGNEVFPRIFVHIDAFQCFWSHALNNLDREIGGGLIGRLCKDSCGLYLDISVSLEALHALEKKDSITFTHNTWNDMNNQVDSNYTGKGIMGWYHTHPGFGTFLSEDDLFIHKNFFNSPYQVAIVIDPLHKRQKLFCLNNDNELMESDKLFVYVQASDDKRLLTLANYYYPDQSSSLVNKAVSRFIKISKKNNRAKRLAVCVDNSICKDLTMEAIIGKGSM